MQSHSRRGKGLLLSIWILLMLLTAGSFWIAEGEGSLRVATAGWVFGIAVVKAHLIAGTFMELASASRIWPALMSFFLIALGGTLFLLF